jgi:hypothetical protein
MFENRITRALQNTLWIYWECSILKKGFFKMWNTYLFKFSFLSSVEKNEKFSLSYLVEETNQNTFYNKKYIVSQ